MTAIKKLIKKIILIVLILLLSLVLGAVICVGLALRDDNTDKYTAEPDNVLVKTLAKGAFLDNEAYLDEDSINGMIAYLIDNAYDNGYFGGDWKLNAAYLDINADTPCRLYMQVNYKGYDIGISADVHILLIDDTINLYIENAYAGKLKLPDSVISYVLSKINLKNSIVNITVNDLTIEVPAGYDLDVGNVGASVRVEIQELELYDNAVYVKTNDIIDYVLENNDLFEIFKNMIGDKIFDYVYDHMDSLPETIEDKFWGFIGALQ